MTVSFNFSQLANNVNSSGKLDASTGLVNATPVANGGTGRSTQTAYALIAGGTTSTGPQQSLASVGTTGQLLVSNGASALPSFQTVTLSGIPLMDVKTSGSGTWTIPSGVTRVRVTVTGGGGNGASGGGGGGGTAIKILTVVAGSLSYSVGGAATSSTVSSGTNNTISTITGGAGSTPSATDSGGAGGVGINGDINFTGGGGTAALTTDLDLRYGGAGGSSYFGGGARGIYNGAGVSGTAYGGGGGGGTGGTANGAGFGGVIIFEY